MFFRRYTLHEKKLSKKISDDNPYKKKLIKMETPTDKHPVYFILVYSLLAYCWLFWGTMFFKKIYGSELGLIIMIFSTCCLFFTYKTSYLKQSKALRTIVFGGAIILSILLELPDKTDISFLSMWNLFLFFAELNQKSYLVLTILAFFMLGVSLCYMEKPYEAYEHFCEFQKKSKKKLTVEDIINANYDLACVLCLISPYMIYLALSSAHDIYRLNLKLLAPIVFLELPPYAYRCFVAKKYLRLFNKNSKSNV